MRIGLTGSLAAGKSTASLFLRQKGIPVLDADLIAHQLYAMDAQLRQQLAAAFGPEILDEHGMVLRPILAQKVFGQPEQLELLNTIVRPALRAQMLDQIAKAEIDNSIVILDAPLIFEGGLESWFDEVWFVYAPAQVRLQRAINRGMSAEQAQARIESQLSDEIKISKAQRILDNQGCPEDLYQQIQLILDEIQGTESGEARIS